MNLELSSASHEKQVSIILDIYKDVHLGFEAVSFTQYPLVNLFELPMPLIDKKYVSTNFWPKDSQLKVCYAPSLERRYRSIAQNAVEREPK